MLTYPGAITLSERTLAFLAGLLQAHRERLRTWRKLSACEQALLVLAHLRHGDTYARLAAGFDVGLATAHRYVREAVAVLAGLGRSLTAALWTLAWTYSNFALLDSTLVRTTRIHACDRLYYSGKHTHHGVNLQGLTDPPGRLIWILRRAARLHPRPDRRPHPRRVRRRRPRTAVPVRRQGLHRW